MIRGKGSVTAKHRRNPSWKWSEGTVNTDDEHFEITYGEDTKPVALVGRGRGRSFRVQFLLPAGSPTRKAREIHEEVRRSLQFYLVELNEQDPWAYAIYHCRTASNMYSVVHWDFFLRTPGES